MPFERLLWVERERSQLPPAICRNRGKQHEAPDATDRRIDCILKSMNVKPLTIKRLGKPMLVSVFMCIVSSCIHGTVVDVVPGSEDCNTGCLAAAAGWPVAYIVDGHGLSPHGSADFIGVLLGLDRLDGLRAAWNWLWWLSAVAAISAAFAFWRNRIKRRLASSLNER